MSFFDDIKGKVEDAAAGAMGSVPDGVKDAAAGAVNNALDAADQVTDKIPGDLDDKLVDGARDLADKLGGDQK